MNRVLPIATPCLSQYASMSFLRGVVLRILKYTSPLSCSRKVSRICLWIIWLKAYGSDNAHVNMIRLFILSLIGHGLFAPKKPSCAPPRSRHKYYFRRQVIMGGSSGEPSKDTSTHHRKLTIPKNLPENFSELSKNAQKRLLKRMHFEATRSEWKAKKREKKQARKLATSENVQEEEQGTASVLNVKSTTTKEPPRGAIIFDMGFNDLMTPTVSLKVYPTAHINSIRK